MRVAVLGIGGLGRTLVSELRQDARVSALLAVDRIAQRAGILGAVPSRIPVTSLSLDVANTAKLAVALRGYDVVVNATLPKFNLSIMRAALEAGTDYLDCAATGPSGPESVPGIFEQLSLSDAFKARGRTGLVSMGLDPGLSNVLAREAADQLERIDAIRIRSGGTTSEAEGGGLPAQYSREAFLADILVPPTTWVDGKLEACAPMSGEESFAFPTPIGTQRVFLVSHEEVKTLPKYLGKPVGRVDYKYAVDPNLVQACLSLQHLGLFEEARTVTFRGMRVPFRQVFLEALPEPSAVTVPVRGVKALAVEVEGLTKGVRTILRRDIVFPNLEAGRRRNTTAVNYLTGAALAVGVALLGGHALPGPGVYPPEVLSPEAVWQEWNPRKIPIVRSERTV